MPKQNDLSKTTQVALALILVFGLIPLSSLAQEYDYDEIVADIEENTQQGPAPRFSFGATSTEFENVAYDLSGQMYSASAILSKKANWQIGMEVPYIIGRNTGIQTQEVGNVQFKSRFNTWQASEEFSIWVPFSARFGQRGKEYVISSHHDTYRLGVDFDYVKDRVGGTVGAGYQARVLEESPKFDVGDIIDYKMALRYGLTSRVTIQSVFQWYRVKATQLEKKEVGKDVDWASIAPGLAYSLVDGLDFTTSLVIPVLQTGTPMETDLAFNEIYYPQTSRVSIAWGLGANF